MTCWRCGVPAEKDHDLVVKLCVKCAALFWSWLVEKWLKETGQEELLRGLAEKAEGPKT